MKIITDCAADMPAEEARELGVEVAPLYIQFPEGEINSSELTIDQFYTRLAGMQPEIPTTSQPSSGLFGEIFERFTSASERVMSIHISSGLSGTFNSAMQAAKQIGGGMVQVVDSQTLSGGERFQVLAAVRAAKAGWSSAAILERLEAVRRSTEVVYTLDTLTYLARGGRIGRVQALAGTLLGLKPIIHVDKADGKYSTVGKTRTISRALQDITNHLAGLYPPEQPLWATVLHGQFEAQATTLAEMLKARLNIARQEILRISPVLGVHTGPGIVGAAVAPLELIEGIG
jgi:DegV family protein with EDD domain